MILKVNHNTLFLWWVMVKIFSLCWLFFKVFYKGINSAMVESYKMTSIKILLNRKSKMFCIFYLLSLFSSGLCGEIYLLESESLLGKGSTDRRDKMLEKPIEIAAVRVQIDLSKIRKYRSFWVWTMILHLHLPQGGVKLFELEMKEIWCNSELRTLRSRCLTLSSLRG